MSTAALHPDSTAYALRQGRWRNAGRIVGIGVSGVAFSVLVGWLLDVPLLKGVLPNAATMKINTALGFVLSGSVLALLATGAPSRAQAAIAAACAATVTVLGAGTLLQELIDADFGIDDLFGTRTSQRMAPASAVAFTLYGTAVLLRDAPLQLARNVAEGLALIVALIGLIALLGYAYGVAALHHFYTDSSMAIHTALLFVLLGLGLLAIRPDRGLAAVVTSEQGGGFIARSILPFALGVPFVLGWLRLWGERQGYYGTEFGLALFASSNIVIFAVLVWLSARAVNRLDAQRQNATTALDASEARTQRVFEQANDAIFVISADNRFLDVNPRGLAMTGYTRAEFLNLSVTDILVPGERSRLDVEPAQMMSSTPHLGEWIHRRKDGSTFLAEVSAGKLSDSSYLAIVRDLTERKRAEEALRVSEERLRLAVTGAGLGSWHWDIASGALVWSEQCLRIFGVSPDTAMSYEKFLTVLHPDDRDFVDQAVRRALDTHSEYKIEYRAIWPDGSEHWIASNGRGYYDATGRPQRMEGVAWDITPRMRAQIALCEVNESLEQKVGERTALLQATEAELRTKNEELKHQNQRVQEATRLKSEFLANMSHELRTPLNAIIGFSELMHDGRVGPVSAQHKEYLGDVLTSAKHLLRLINDVLDLAKVEAGKLVFKPEPIDLTKTLGEARDVVRALILSKQLQVAIEVDPTLSRIVADAGKLKQILYNYLSNAIKFSDRGGAISVRARPENQRQFRLEVEDHGIGIESADIDRLFSEFQQLDSGATKRHVGTGLGLALTKRIVEAQGGEVGVVSEVGKGSVFFAVLPRVLAAGPAQTPPQPLPLAGTLARRGSGG